MIDINAKRAEGKGIGYERWASVFNLKQMASAKFIYDTTGYASLEEFDDAVKAAQTALQDSRTALKSFDAKIAENSEMQKWVVAYAKTRDVRDGLKKIKSEKKRAAYRVENESDFAIADAAVRFFKSHSVTKIPTRKSFQAEKERLISEKNAVYAAYMEQQANSRELSAIQQNLAVLRDKPQPQNSKKHENERKTEECIWN